LIRLIFIFVVLINLRGLCQSQILVTLSNPPEKVIPGGHFTLFFDVKSTSSLPDTLQETIVLPDKWNLLSQRKPERITGQKELRYFFVIGTPAESGAGDFSIYFKLKSGQQEITTPVQVTIQQFRRIEIFVVSRPEFVKEGDTLRIEYLVQNSGNRTEKFAMKTNRGIIENFADSIALEPNSKAKVIVNQVIPFTENNAWQTSSDLTLNMAGDEVPVYQIVTVPVFSSKIRKIDPYFRFPIEIGGGYLSYMYGNKSMTAYQYTATGSGFTDQNGKHYVDFTIRGPNQFVFPAIGSYDQYSLNYQYKKKTFLSVGDYVLQLNNLMEFGRFGRGIRLEQNFKKMGYTVFYQKARFYLNQKDAAGGKFIYKINESSNLALSYASKNVIFHNVNFWSDLLGISATIRTKDIQLDTELATGYARGKTDYGSFVKFQFVRNWITVNINLIYTGKNFYGFYNNSLLINNNIGFNITKKLTLGITTNFSNVNPGLDANFYSVSPKDRSYTAFVTYQLNLKNRFFIFYSTQEREDKQQPSKFHYAENFGNISYNYNAGKFALFYQGRYGYSRNLQISDNSETRESFSNLMQPSVKIFPWIWIGGYFEHQHTNKFSAADIVQDLFYYGGNARVNVKRNLYANFLYRNNYAPDELYIRRSYMDASLLLDLKRHRFTLTGGHSFVPNIENSNQNTLFFTLKYALKLNIPLSKKRNVGRVRGKLTGIGFPKAGNLIQLGSHKFLTDSTGRFSFEGISPDQYYLSMTQNGSKNDGVIPNIKMPMYIHVKADSTNEIEIPLTRTGNIQGKVEFSNARQIGLSSILGQRPTVLIKLTNETTSFLTELNEKEEFSFKEMKPGNWTLSAFIPGNQDRFLIEESQKQLDIEIDKTMNVTFKVSPNEKRIHFSTKSFEVSVKK